MNAELNLHSFHCATQEVIICSKLKTSAFKFKDDPRRLLNVSKVGDSTGSYYRLYISKIIGLSHNFMTVSETEPEFLSSLEFEEKKMLKK